MKTELKAQPAPSDTAQQITRNTVEMANRVTNWPSVPNDDGPPTKRNTARDCLPVLSRHDAALVGPRRQETTCAKTILQCEHRGRRVLLSEDDEINQMVAQDLLVDAGLRVDVADDGIEAVALACTYAYDLILMDIMMPRMDGLEATRAIRCISRHRDTPIVAYSSNVEHEDVQRCLEAGMNDHLAKPADPDNLYQTILDWLNQRYTVAPNPA